MVHLLTASGLFNFTVRIYFALHFVGVPNWEIHKEKHKSIVMCTEPQGEACRMGMRVSLEGLLISKRYIISATKYPGNTPEIVEKHLISKAV